MLREEEARREAEGDTGDSRAHRGRAQEEHRWRGGHTSTLLTSADNEDGWLRAWGASERNRVPTRLSNTELQTQPHCTALNTASVHMRKVQC